MKKHGLIGGAVLGCLAAAGLTACGSKASDTTGTTGSGGGAASSSSKSTTGSATGGGSTTSAGTGGLGGGATTTIAAARAGNVTTAITVDVVVTALHGVPGDDSQWYIEDPAGGPSSGVAVYCDPDLPSCPKTIAAPPVQTLVRMTGALSTYKGALQFVPTAQTVLTMNVALPPIATVTATDIVATADSPYRGVLVHFGSKLTVDDATPAALYDTQCNTGATDAGLPLCSGCAPPTYSGFRVNDGSGNEIYIENFFFDTEHLQSSPECTTAAGAIPVTVGMTFSKITGVLDFDPYSSAQALSPVTDADYTTP